MKTIGILGGFGPQATMEMEAAIHHASQRFIPQQQNSGYPPMIVYYNRHPPVILKEDFSPVRPLQPDPRLLEAAKKLGPMVDFIIIPSNGLHALQSEIEQAAGCKVLSMIDATLDEVRKRQWHKIGVVGFGGKPMVYINRFTELNLSFETINDTLQEKLDVSIMRVMEGKNDDEDRALTLEVVMELRAKKVDGIILGCTEIPILLGQYAEGADLLNPGLILAEAAVKYSLSASDTKSY